MKATFILWYNTKKGKRRTLFVSPIIPETTWFNIKIPETFKFPYKNEIETIGIKIGYDNYVWYDCVRLGMNYKYAWFNKGTSIDEYIKFFLLCRNSYKKLSKDIEDPKILKRIKTFKGNVVII